MSFVSAGSTDDPDSEMMLHFARNVEEARRAVVQECEFPDPVREDRVGAA